METVSFNAPTCKFCGQAVISDEKFKNLEEESNWATAHCNCEQAREYQVAQERIKEREKNIARARDTMDNLNEYCKEKSVPFPEDVDKILFDCAVLVVENVLDAANLTYGKTKIKITLNTKGQCSFTLVFTDGVKMVS
jgi:hypothetical protein